MRGTGIIKVRVIPAYRGKDIRTIVLFEERNLTSGRKSDTLRESTKGGK